MKSAFEKKLDRQLTRFKEILSKYPGKNVFRDIDYDASARVNREYRKRLLLRKS